MPAGDNVIEPITFVLTSCRRFDLLERTLASFFATNDYPIARYVVIEDSPNDGIHGVVAKFPEYKIEVMQNREPLGQLRSIDRAYATVDTEYIFHCEDDWHFAERGVVRDSLTLLSAFPDVILVLPRVLADLPDFAAKAPITETDGVRYKPVDPLSHHVWWSFSFNPGLRRRSDYLKLGSYAAVGPEGTISIAYKRMGYRMVVLENGGVTHIGENRRTGPLDDQPRPRTIQRLVNRTRNSIKTRVDHYWWLMSGGPKGGRP